MSIWSSEIKELERLYESFKGQLPELRKELGQLIHFDDPNVLLLYSRRCLEVIITDLCEGELNRERGTEPLKGIIDKLNKEKKIPSHIASSMYGLNELSTYGTHPKDFDPYQVRPVLNNLDIIIRWYLKYKNIITSFKEETEEQKILLKEEPVKDIRQIEINKTPRKKFKNLKIFTIVGIVIISVLVITMLIINQKKKNYARQVLIPEIQKLVDENFTPPVQAFELASEAIKIIPGDTLLISLWNLISENITFTTRPEGAKVYWKDYNHPEDSWKEIGITPLKDEKVPIAFKRIKIEKEGYETIFLTGFNLLDMNKPLVLDSIGILPQNMVHVPTRTTQMVIIGLEKYGRNQVGEFYVDRFEVTNKEFRQFIDSGGYSDKSYWKYPIYKEGKEITWESAISLFVDETGRQGPARWEAGTYPEGKESHPVAGISWYEAAAYAAFRGKRLPSVYHWNVIIQLGRGTEIIPLSNYGGVSTVPVGSKEGFSSYGIYDLAGNVREWCYNGNGVKGESYILGGGWNDATYTFNEAGAQPSIDRSMSNGFRCIMKLPEDTAFNALTGDLKREFRDYSKEKSVDDKTFNIFLRQYEYDKTPLNAQAVSTIDTGAYITEKIVMDAGYNNEHLIVYLFLPRNKKPPYQPVIFFPGSNAILMDIKKTNYMYQADFICKSGRSVVYPILKGNFERPDELYTSNSGKTVFYKDHVIMWRRDIGRTLDYLETRDDFLTDKIGYFGFSWGGRMGGLFPAVEKRLKVLVLHVGGMSMYEAFPEVDPINFITRINQPVLMLNGEYDMYFPVNTSQIPMYNLFGTPPKDKKIIIYKSGHRVPRIELIKETLNWYDKYLGPVE